MPTTTSPPNSSVRLYGVDVTPLLACCACNGVVNYTFYSPPSSPTPPSEPPLTPPPLAPPRPLDPPPIPSPPLTPCLFHCVDFVGNSSLLHASRWCLKELWYGGADDHASPYVLAHACQVTERATQTRVQDGELIHEAGLDVAAMRQDPLYGGAENVTDDESGHRACICLGLW